MKYVFCICFICMLLTSCAPRISLDERAADFYPYDLQVNVNDSRMTLTWKKHGDGLMSGYNIYISEQPLANQYPGRLTDASITPFNPAVYPGDTDSDEDKVSFLAEDLINGVHYFVTVSIVFPDGTESRPTNEVEVVCGPRGEIELSLRYQSERDGYSFEKNSYTRADASDNDIYFFSKDGVDFLCSPKRLNGFLNDTKFMSLPYTGTLAEVGSRVAQDSLTSANEREIVSVGDWVLVRTAGNGHALVHVLSIDGEGKERQIRLYFAFCPAAGEMFF